MLVVKTIAKIRRLYVAQGRTTKVIRSGKTELHYEREK
jgi:hypothetical protein